MINYKYLREHIFDETASKRLSQYADTSKEDIKAGEFLLQGRIYSLPYTHGKNYDSYLILFTLSGDGQLTYRGADYALGTGDGFLIDCHEEHSYQTAGECWKHIILHFNGRDAAFYYKTYFSDGSPLFHFTQAAHCQNLLDEIVESVCSIKFNRELKTSIQIQTLILQLSEHRINSREVSETTDDIRYLCKYMENHFAEELTLNELAKFCGYHPSYLCRAFKKETGYSPKEYITILRLEQAKELLYNTLIPVYKIGLLVGIPDETNFTRLFKKYVHDTPGRYRKKMQ